MRLAVIGTGALGSAVLRLLAGMEVRDVLLIDPDPVEERNLHQSPFLRQAAEYSRTYAARLSKAELLAAEANRRWGLPWTALPAEIADVGWQNLQDRDLLLCCTDSALSRAETAYIARMLGKPLLEAGVFGDGMPAFRVSWTPASPGAACYLCGMTEERRAQVLAYAASASLGCVPLDVAPPMTGTPETLERAAEMLGRMLEEFACGTLGKNASFAVRCTHTEGRWEETRLDLPRSAHCPWHDLPQGRLIALPWDRPLRESLADVGENAVLQFPWQVCTMARCPSCGMRCAPMVRVARVRRRYACPGCGTGPLEPLACIDTVRKEDTVAQRTPQELGDGSGCLYLIRKPHLQTATMSRAKLR